MSLDYYLDKIENYREVCYHEATEQERAVYFYDEGALVLNVDTHAIIWGTMAVDMGQITEKNCTEFYFRLQIHRAHMGHPPITLESVRKHIGLRTNVGTISRASWFKRWSEWRFKALTQEIEAAERLKAKESTDVG